LEEDILPLTASDEYPDLPAAASDVKEIADAGERSFLRGFVSREVRLRTGIAFRPAEL
jgi:hypothetical protein